MKKNSILAFLVFLVIFPLVGEAKVRVTPVPYTHEGVSLEGMLAWDDTIQGKRPGILVVHEWWGLNEYAKSRAKQLAALGYVALAVDMYGKGKVTTHGEKASQWMKETTANVSAWQARARAGFNLLKADSRVDSGRLAAIGYCFGGATVVQMVYDGAPLKGVVSFHGSLPLPPQVHRATDSTKIFIAHGGSDPFLSMEHITKFLQGLDRAQLDWQMTTYGEAQHSFTNPTADEYGMKGVQYHPEADRRSWAHMKLFFEEIFQ